MKLPPGSKVFARFKITEKDGTELVFAAVYNQNVLVQWANDMADNSISGVELLNGLVTLLVKRAADRCTRQCVSGTPE